MAKSGHSSVYINDGTGTFNQINIPIAIDRLAISKMIDMDGDGDIDVLYKRGNVLYIAENQVIP